MNKPAESREFRSIDDRLKELRELSMDPNRNLRETAAFLVEMTADEVRDEAELILSKKSNRIKSQRDMIMSLCWEEAILLNRQAEAAAAALVHSAGGEASS